MKDYMELEKILKEYAGDNLAGFFYREKINFEQEIKIFDLVYQQNNFSTPRN